MKMPSMLARTLLEELSRDLDLPAERDVAYLLHRIEHEGLSFLTITLPLLSDSLERGLESGNLTIPTNFSRCGSLPRFLGGFFRLVFDRSGVTLSEPSVNAIYGIRQFCRFFKKLRIDCDEHYNSLAIKKYRSIEEELKAITPKILRSEPVLDAVSRIIWSEVFPEIKIEDIIPRHGPGATAERKTSNKRFAPNYWYERLEHEFPAADMLYHNYGSALSAEAHSKRISDIDYKGVDQEVPVRVVFVPKTLTSPRVIAVEPSVMQFCQQAVMQFAVPLIESHQYTRNSVRFSDQSVNRSLAHRASIDRSLATIDLSDASDRVHFELVRRIFNKSSILPYLEACRSAYARLPDDTEVILSKFASQGSALCFPVEACVFYTLIQSAFHIYHGKAPTCSSIKRYSSMIDIYGDDIIVPTYIAGYLMDFLESYGLKVNKSKSFLNSLFRESCGGDFYSGTPVFPVYAREIIPSNPQEWTEKQRMSWISTSDQLYMVGLWKTAQFIRDVLQGSVSHVIPRTRKPGAGLAFYSMLFDTNLRFDASTYSYSQRRITYEPSLKRDTIDGDGTACFNKAFSRVHCGKRVEAPFGAKTVFSYNSSIVPNDEGANCTLRLPLVGQARSSMAGNAESDPEGTFVSLEPSWSEPCIPILFGAYDPSDREPVRKDRIFPREDFVPLDFSSSVKRGVFKSKRRWFNIYS